MKRLRHPVRAITEPFGKAGLIVACLALVAAMGGTALAASTLNSTQKKEVEKIAKKFAGKPGAAGATGLAGATGPAGAIGPAGPTGAAGKNGSNGTNGTNGTNGSPWTLGGTLPTGATETGVWTLGPAPEGTVTFGSYASLSFPIPLEAALPSTKVHFINLAGKEMPGELTQTACPGTVEEPTAEPENLCVYEGHFLTAEFIRIDKVGGVESKGASTAGAKLVIKLKEEEASGWGTYAVAGPEA